MRLLLIILIATLFSACKETSSPPEESLQNVSATASPSAENGSQLNTKAHIKSDVILAQIGTRPVYQSQIDKQIEKELYELEWAKYELRRSQLAKWLDQKMIAGVMPTRLSEGSESSAPEIDVLIKPPLPPRIDWAEKSLPSMGSSDAPVTLSIFCNYQSIHCAKMQATYEALLTQYPGQVRMEFNELPLRFHRFAFSASIAARCAAQFNQFAPFHRALWVDQNALTRDNYLRIAGQLNIDLPSFEQCLDDTSQHQQVRSKAERALQAGFNTVPITLVNGLYLSGPKSVDTLRYFIDLELAHQGLSPPSVPDQGYDMAKGSAQLDASGNGVSALPETQLPLRLEGVTESDVGRQAMIQHTDSGQSQIYSAQDSLMDGVSVLEIMPAAIILDNQGVRERLSLSGDAQARMANAQQTREQEDTGGYSDQALEDIARAIEASNNVLDSNELPPSDIEFQFRGVVAPKGQTPLSRAWLSEQLSHKADLEKHFQPAALEVEGTHLVKLTGVESENFYSTLGLQEGDVVMRVNGEWVHEASNNLFSALASEEEVSVVLMRRGLPVHYQYAIN